MRTVRITSREAIEALFPLVDDDISTVEGEEETVVEVAGIDALITEELGDLTELDALVDEAEREWADAERVESFRVSRELTDGVRARRAHRRAAREALRSLPVQLDVTGSEEAA